MQRKRLEEIVLRSENSKKMVEFYRQVIGLENIGITIQSGEHPTFGLRSIYLYDPDGNSMELVCYDEALFDPVLNQKVQPTI
jgi:catechol-2,3-dioxygenase